MQLHRKEGANIDKPTSESKRDFALKKFRWAMDYCRKHPDGTADLVAMFGKHYTQDCKTFLMQADPPPGTVYDPWTSSD